MARASVKVSKTTKTVKFAKSRNKSSGNPNKCPVCGKFMGSGKKRGKRKNRNKEEVATNLFG